MGSPALVSMAMKSSWSLRPDPGRKVKAGSLSGPAWGEQRCTDLQNKPWLDWLWRSPSDAQVSTPAVAGRRLSKRREGGERIICEKFGSIRASTYLLSPFFLETYWRSPFIGSSEDIFGIVYLSDV
mgnify:CR=1 FL=1